MVIACLSACTKDQQQPTETSKANIFRVTNRAAQVVGNSYYIDPNGNDSNSGTSTTAAWKTIAKVNSQTFMPGDQLFFKCGGSWTGNLVLNGSGSASAPIVVNKYGSGSNPVINGGGTANGSAAILLQNVSYWQLNNLEITNTVPATFQYAVFGIFVNNTSTGAMTNIDIESCYVHDVNSTGVGNANYSKGSGGIWFNGLINNILVQNNIIDNCAIEGLRTSSNTQASNVVFNNNTVENIYGDGIVLHGVTGGSKITNNIVYNVCTSSAANFAAIWTYASTQTVVSGNEVYGIQGGGNDGEAFDADISTNGDIFEYNYTHDNNRGFMLFMPNATNIIVRFNISANDVKGGSKLFNFTATGSSNMVYNNVFYLTNNIAYVFETGLNGTFSNNILCITGSFTNFSQNAMTSSAVLDNNLFYPAPSTPQMSNSSHAGNIYSYNPQSDNPKFVNAAAYGIGRSTAAGFKLSSSSPCINAGTAITGNGGYDFFGTALTGTPDIGAANY